MGKKDYILDSGKKAQSSMALYWKNHKQRSKHPKEKVQRQQDQEQVNDKRVMSNFEKWKMHKQKLITKAYTKPPSTTTEKNIEQNKEQQQDDQMLQKLLQKKKPRPMTVPGFKSKNDIASKLQIQKPKQADQSTNVLKLPAHMGQLTQQEIVQMLRQRKNKQQLMKKYNETKNIKKSQDQEGDVLLGEDFISLDKKKEKQQIEKQPIQQEKQQKPQPSFFKSDLLNKIQKEGLQKGLLQVNKKSQNLPQKSQNQNVKAQESKKQQLKVQPQKNRLIEPKFIPRVLKK